MRVETSILGASCVVLGVLGYASNLTRQVNLADDKIPACVVAHTLGESIRTGLLSRAPKFDHDGSRWECRGLPYDACCRTYGIMFLGKVGNTPHPADAMSRLATTCGYHWDPFQTVDPGNTRA